MDGHEGAMGIEGRRPASAKGGGMRCCRHRVCFGRGQADFLGSQPSIGQPLHSGLPLAGASFIPLVWCSEELPLGRDEVICPSRDVRKFLSWPCAKSLRSTRWAKSRMALIRNLPAFPASSFRANSRARRAAEHVSMPASPSSVRHASLHHEATGRPREASLRPRRSRPYGIGDRVGAPLVGALLHEGKRSASLPLFWHCDGVSFSSKTMVVVLAATNRQRFGPRLMSVAPRVWQC